MPRVKGPIRWVALGVGVVLIGFCVVAAIKLSKGTQEPSLPRLVQEHAPAPAFTLDGLDGKTINSAQLKGKTVVVNFFNSWCIPCQQEAPELKAFYAEHKNDPDFAMVGIVLDDDAATMKPYVQKEQIEWPVGMDLHGEASLGFGTTGQPETYIMGPNGIAACGNLGASSQAALDVWLQIAQAGEECAAA
jgi:cytochrome c biogenesis protein CcmG/thiol:disulfide interchange protein DsbE